MKKSLITLLALIPLLFCACEKDPQPSNNNERTPDITPYLGNYLMTRSTNFTLDLMGLATFPLDYDLDVEVVNVKADPNVQYGVIMTSNDGMYLKGTVDTVGLHLQNDTINIDIDTLGASASVMVSMTHPIISAPVDGRMEWTSTAEGTTSVTLPIIGKISATITGNMKYSTVASN